jgi:hypothetical protein
MEKSRAEKLCPEKSQMVFLGLYLLKYRKNVVFDVFLVFQHPDEGKCG